MRSEKLPVPIDISVVEEKTFESIVEYVYQNYFRYEFMSRTKREKLFGKFIYFEIDFIMFMPERFWHLISYKASEKKYTVDPCVNTYDSLICKKSKYECVGRVCIPTDARLAGRSECIYRVRRVHWINPILKLANEKDSSVSVWSEDRRDKKNKLIRKVYIRFKDGCADYLIILLDNSVNGGKGYRFITAYPVVHNGTKRSLERKYKDSLK